jgi:hypothetical protein
MLAAVGAIGVAAAIAWRRAGERAFAAMLVALVLGYGLVATPILDPSSSARRIMERARALAGPASPIALVQWKEQNLLQAVGPTVEFGFRRDPREQLRAASEWLARDPGQRWLFVSQPGDGDTCFGGPPGAVSKVGTSNRRDYYLARYAALTPRCYQDRYTDRSP